MPQDILTLASIVAQITIAAGALGALFFAYRNNKKADEAKVKAASAAAAAVAAKLAAEDSKKEIIATKDGVFEIGKQIDGRLKELLAVSEKAAFARGQLNPSASSDVGSEHHDGDSEKK